jgi:hypothetical protein
MHIKITIIILLIVIIFLLYKKQKENFSAEAINTLVSLYTDNTRAVNLNNLDISGNLNVKGDISGNTIYGKNVKVLNNVDISGNLHVTGDISGNFNKNYIRAQYIQVGNDLEGRNGITDIDYKDYWTISEIVAIDDNNKNVAKGITPTIIYGTEHDSTHFPLSAATDGVIDKAMIYISNPDATNIYHGSTGENLIEIDLGTEKNLTQINLFGRYSTDVNMTNRLNGTYIKLLDKNKKEVKLILTGRWENIHSKQFIL